MKKRLKIIFLALLVICFISGCTDMSARSNAKYTVYNCDVKHLKLATTIEIYKDGEKFGQVRGNIFTLVEDPLTLYDINGNRIGYAGDSYKFIAQDSHGLYLNDKFKYDMVGLVDLFGETYDLYDLNGKMVANAMFNSTSTSGNLKDINKNIIATYESGFFSSDFNIRIKKNANIEDEIIIMLFASYYSDYSYDSN